MNKNIEAWFDYQGEDFVESFDDAFVHYQLVAETESDDREITLVSRARVVQRVATAALVDACYRAVAGGIPLRAVADRAGASDITIMRWVNDINALEQGSRT